jgi:DNA-binding PadR family transcriptional regulator
VITLLVIHYFTDDEEYISLTDKGRETLAALLMEEVKKNPNLLNDSDDD